MSDERTYSDALSVASGCLSSARKWILEGSSFDFYEALKKLKDEWRYKGPLTIEPEGRIDSSCFDNLARAMETIRSCPR